MLSVSPVLYRAKTINGTITIYKMELIRSKIKGNQSERNVAKEGEWLIRHKSDKGRQERSCNESHLNVNTLIHNFP